MSIALGVVGSPPKDRVMRTEVDGIPVFWTDLGEPAQIAVCFRAGRGDETLPTAGLTHLVEHLALFGLGTDDERANGFVDHLRTVFYTSGAITDVRTFPASLAQALRNLPLDRVELEKRVLLTEAASTPRTSWAWLMGLRFGAAGFGLVDYAELGLHGARVRQVESWAAERFVVANAAIWMTCEPPDSFGLELPPGRRHEPPSVAAMPQLALPAYVPAGAGAGVVSSFVGTRSTALTVALALLERRVHRRLRLEQGLSYAATGRYAPLTADRAHVTFGADCLDEHAKVVRDQVVDELHRLADEGPEAEELESIVTHRVTEWSESQSTEIAELDSCALNQLLGAPQPTRSELIRELEELTPEEVAAAVGEIVPTAILSAPAGESPPDGFARYAPSMPPPITERNYRRTGLLAGSRSRISASERGITFTPDPPGKPVTILFSDVVAAIELGPGRVELVGPAGEHIRVDTLCLRDGTRLLSDIRRGVPSHLFVAYESDRQSMVDLSREKIGPYTGVAREIESLQGYLQAGERVLTMAGARRGMRRRGLLALTDRRLLFLAEADSPKPQLVAVQLADVTAAKQGIRERLQGGIVVGTSHGRHSFTDIFPRERVAEFFEGLATPRSPRVIDRATSPRFVRDYCWGALLLLAGVALMYSGAIAAVWLAAWGVRRLLRGYRRQRFARATAAAARTAC